MFGYLNLNDPTKIANTEAQEATNVRVDRGYLEFQMFAIDKYVNKRVIDFSGRRIFLDNTKLGSGFASREVNIEIPGEGRGFTHRVLNDDSIDIVGTLMIVAPIAEVVVNPSGDPSFYPPGNYDFLVTLFDPATDEESRAEAYNLTILDGQQVEFHETATAFMPDLTKPSRLSFNKAKLKWRIYRRPLSSDLFLLSKEVDAFPTPATVVDDVSDTNLGFAYSGIETYTPYELSQQGKQHIITMHNGRLWYVQDFLDDAASTYGTLGSAVCNVLRFSSLNRIGEIPINNYFAFNSKIVGVHSLNEYLVVLCKEEVFLIYGNDETDFVVKQLTDSDIGCPGLQASVKVFDSLFFLGSNKGNRDTADGIYTIRNGQMSRISDAIEPLFKDNSISAYSYSALYNPPSHRERNFGVGIFDARFFVACYVIPPFSSTRKFIVLDGKTGGFLLGEVGLIKNFYYRSKEYGRPGQWDNMRRAFVRGLGQFTIELYYDRVKVDTITFNITGSIPQTRDFTVPPFRGYYFSFRFIGNTETKIYEFGRLE
jgi:hypothetical protein